MAAIENIGTVLKNLNAVERAIVTGHPVSEEGLKRVNQQAEGESLFEAGLREVDNTKKRVPKQG